MFLKTFDEIYKIIFCMLFFMSYRQNQLWYVGWFVKFLLTTMLVKKKHLMIEDLTHTKKSVDQIWSAHFLHGVTVNFTFFQHSKL